MRIPKTITNLTVAVCVCLALVANAAQPRSASAKHAFQRNHPCPSTGQPRGKCPGYIIDHIKALACGGPDSPDNMQWQTVSDAKAKDKWERKECGK